jgi:hypothetical protein
MDEGADEREEKLISTFQIVRFPNDVCVGTNSRNGTCYTSAECSDKGGTSSGSCADGFGVCCTFLISTCGSSSSENITYWTQPSAGASYGTCSLDICPSNDDICSIRLDFTSFTITGPSTQSIANQIGRKAGQPAGHIVDTHIIKGSSWASNCLLDTFTVTGSSPSNTPPVICGQLLANTHVYVSADVDRCNKMNFFFADQQSASMTALPARGVTSLATRVWDITATQIECTSQTLPPSGCTQYFYGSGGAMINSFNWKSTTVATTNMHLGMQHQRICIRRERGYCTGCFSSSAAGFAVSGLSDTVENYTATGGCCGYGTMESRSIFGMTADHFDDIGVGVAASTYMGFDCIIIPGAQAPQIDDAFPNQVTTAAQNTASKMSQTIANSPNAGAVGVQPVPPQICGNGAGLGIGAASLNEAVFEGTTDTSFGEPNAMADDDNMAGGSAVNLTICTRSTPFMLEFLSDDMEGLGSNADDAENADATQSANQGFIIMHEQLACV